MNAIKYYKSYIGLGPRIILFLLFPISVAAFAGIQLGIFRYRWSISVIFGLTMLVSQACIFFVDRWSVGPIMAKRGQDDELIKSSPKGAEFLRNVLILDIIFRFILLLFIVLIIIAVTVMTGFFENDSTKIMSSAILCVISMYGVSNSLIFVSRHITDMNSLILIFYGLEFVFIPAVIAIFIGVPAAMYILAIIYFIINVISIAANVSSINKLVNKNWYKD